MIFTNRSLTITDDAGTNYADLFTDIDTDTIDFDDPHGRRRIDAMVPNDPHSPRANADGPLGALIVRWIQARVDSPADRYGWQYLDAVDIHTITYLDHHTNELEFINIFGHTDHGRRGYRLHALAAALDLLVEFDPRRDEAADVHS